MNTDTIKPILKYYGLSILVLIPIYTTSFISVFRGGNFTINILLFLLVLYLLLPTISLIKKGIALTGMGGFLLEVFYILYLTFLIFGLIFNYRFNIFTLFRYIIFTLFTLSIILYPLIQNISIIRQNIAKSQSITNLVKYCLIGILGLYSIILYFYMIQPSEYRLWAIAIFSTILLLKNTIPDKYQQVSNTDSNISANNKIKVLNPIKRMYIISFIIVLLVNISIVILYGLEFYNYCSRPDLYFGCGYSLLGLILAIPALPTLLIFLLINIFMFWKYKEKVNVFTRYVLFIFSGFAILGILFVGSELSDTGLSSYSKIIFPLILIKGVIDLYYLIKIRKVLKLESSHTKIQVPEVIESNQDVNQIEKINTF